MILFCNPIMVSITKRHHLNIQIFKTPFQNPIDSWESKK